MAAQEVRARDRAAISDAKSQAVAMTEEAEREIAEHRSLLLNSLGVEHRVDWDRAAQVEPFDEPEPSLALILVQRSVPARNWLLELLRIRSKANRLEAEALAHGTFEQAHGAWKQAREAHDLAVQEHHEEIRRIKAGYEARDEEALASYVALALAEAPYPETFPSDLEVACTGQDPVAAVVQIDVPRMEDVPQIASWRVDAARRVIASHPISQSSLADLYDGIVYQAALRTLHEVFDSDYDGIIGRATVNVYTTRVDSATGVDERICVASCEAERERFLSFDLSRVEPRDCFRALNGLVAKRPSALAKVQPLRVIDTRSDAGGLAVEVILDQPAPPDLLELDPLEFEQLVGSLFQRVFAREGANVEVTKASHDGGVDVVVVDPDEIKGGKTVIQVKRYRGVVSPGFVRDLYGTMINEGAAKGILVATGHFGPEARAFAMGKPITLIDSDGLLGMLEEHGYRYRINGGAG
jgi:restriction system protein